jgi:hypothetical protein
MVLVAAPLRLWTRPVFNQSALRVKRCDRKDASAIAKQEITKVEEHQCCDEAQFLMRQANCGS